MAKQSTPEAWANRVTRVLDVVLTDNRFPTRVADVAIELSRQLYPVDPIVRVHGESLPGFDGALLRVPGGKSGWAIIYNDGLSSRGRINFTLAHELGHYFVHRERFPDGFRCGSGDVVGSEATDKRVEAEANTFAAYVLMPFNDYRKQLPPDESATFERLSACADRYSVSLVAATLRWLHYTEKRAALVLSRDGFVLWSKLSRATRGASGFVGWSKVAREVPKDSPAADEDLRAGSHVAVDHPSDVWCKASCTESVIRSDQYDFTMSLLHLGPEPEHWPSPSEAEEENDGMVSTSDFMRTPFARTP